MGQGANDSAARPVRTVTLRGFALGQFPVTVAEWKACAAQGGCGPLPRMALAEDATPLHNVSWDDAQQYIAWLSRSTGRTYRLPTEAEWEYAARAGTQTRYWWGDQLGTAKANCAECGGDQDARGPLPVDSFPPNAFGLYAMLGGVAQWVQDCWAPNYQGAPVDGSARECRAAACAASCAAAPSAPAGTTSCRSRATSTTRRCGTRRTASAWRATSTERRCRIARFPATPAAHVVTDAGHQGSQSGGRNGAHGRLSAGDRAPLR